MSREALYYNKLNDQKVQCTLCPHQCIIKTGQFGKCRVRKNTNGILIADTYGKLSAMNLDPIEKKPLYHFFPGTQILSLGSVGCNMRCSCCQNYSISQVGSEHIPRYLNPKINDIISKSNMEPDNIGIAFTYNEPGIWFEYMFDIAESAKAKNLKTVVVSNGYLSLNPLKDLLPFIDAFNIDIKGATKEVYEQFAKASLMPVLTNLELIRKTGKHLEITYLLVPEVNDNPREFKKLIDWIAKSLGRDTPLHLSRYFPNYKMQTKATDPDILYDFASLASEKLNYVYVGNIAGSEFKDTVCPNCAARVIARDFYHTQVLGIDESGECTSCKTPIVNLN